MNDETTPNQRLRAIRLDDEAQVRRWAVILGPPPASLKARRLSQRLSPYLDGARIETAKTARHVGIGGRARS